MLITAKLLGIEADQRTLAWCPACGTESGREKYTHKLRRDGSKRVGVAPSGLAWFCYLCREGGSAADMVSYARFKRPASELSREMLRELGAIVDRLTGDMPVLPARAPYMPPQRLTPAELEQRVREADERRWQHTLDEAAAYLHELRERTGTTTEREAWHALRRFEPPPTSPETSPPIRWRGERLTWGALRAAHLIALAEQRERYFAELAELELRDGGNHG